MPVHIWFFMLPTGKAFLEEASCHLPVLLFFFMCVCVCVCVCGLLKPANDLASILIFCVNKTHIDRVQNGVAFGVFFPWRFCAVVWLLVVM
ncbi:hypothetical protein BO86DRAFT_47720 [Aspergillus japonicus CBS 114.51]|uniref:Uncharacterized protein n=1 Tax=Aspergillus japonicus CBS 114.51 TaxID=1448312 RepID=A0A8T8X5X7_ASPJA|nr:hypothetical protein BO86DRAFT_47720 [Aspergillus japonicus CBS 114.51]RAH83360.1 hypothetical protein BO86DRAFT_47720 [Aspergillus japonicus CBS 114.51]